MTTKKPVLGRNLSSMLSKSTLRHAVEESGRGVAGGDGSLRKLALDRVRPGPYQPRSAFDADSLQELADSIRAQGVIQPIVVRAVGDEFEIIAGERRWRAAQQAGIEEIPAIVRDVDDEAAVALALIENIQRENLNPLEEAAALKRLVDDFQLTHQEAAEAVGRSRSTVSNLLRLLELSDEVRELVDARHLEMGHARALLSLSHALQVRAAREVVKKELSVRETERLVRRLLNPPKQKTRTVDPDIARLQNDLSERLCAKVSIQHGKKGRGKLVIAYNSADELEGIIGHLKGEE
ncbi:MAG: ParB/RepB/Spo0J family partition protein [Xanthomonadales bacterium]|nr:ParB/RepB/Spo0J family partition protein [Xanthomonadales bacterium]NIX12365.1 ParB/RepB/Spo0J family partition protein [Xanthomonadales bacterium]